MKSTKTFCVKCCTIKKYEGICTNCNLDTINVGTKTIWPNHPKRADYEYMSVCLAYGITKFASEEVIELTRDFCNNHKKKDTLTKYSNNITKPSTEESYNNIITRKTTKILKIKIDEPVHIMLNGTQTMREFYRDVSDDSVYPKYFVKAGILLRGFIFSKKDIKGMFIPKKPKIKKEDNENIFSNGIKFVYNNDTKYIAVKDAFPLFKTEKDALMYSYEIALLAKNCGVQEIEQEAEKHLKICKVSLLSELPHYYL